MAVSNHGTTQTFIAGEDLSDKQFFHAGFDGSGDAVLSVGATGNCIGIIVDAAADGEPVGILSEEGSRVPAVAGAPIAIGALLACTTTGKVITATTGDRVFGIALTAAAADGDLFEMSIQRQGIIA